MSSSESFFPIFWLYRYKVTTIVKLMMTMFNLFSTNYYFHMLSYKGVYSSNTILLESNLYKNFNYLFYYILAFLSISLLVGDWLLRM